MKPSKFGDYFQIGSAVIHGGGGCGYIKDIEDSGVYILNPDDDIIFIPWNQAVMWTGSVATRHVEKQFKDKQSPDIERNIL
jgi:hypothetical protein